MLFAGNFTFGALRKCIKNFSEVTVLKKEWKKIKSAKRHPSASTKTSACDVEEIVVSKMADTEIEAGIEASTKEESVLPAEDKVVEFDDKVEAMETKYYDPSDQSPSRKDKVLKLLKFLIDKFTSFL